MKKIFLLLSIGVFMISLTSALEFDNIKSLPTITKDMSTDIGLKTIPYNEIWEKYPIIEINNMFGLGETLFSGALTEHTETCGESCLSQMEIHLENDGVLIDNIIFNTLQDDGSWVEQSIRNYNFEYWGSINDYEYQCIDVGEILKNGTQIQECSNVIVGSHEGWINYNIGEEVLAGDYTLRLNGKKSPLKTVDWIIETNGKTLDEWAVWGTPSQLIWDEIDDSSINTTVWTTGSTTGTSFTEGADYLQIHTTESYQVEYQSTLDLNPILNISRIENLTMQVQLSAGGYGSHTGRTGLYINGNLIKQVEHTAASGSSTDNSVYWILRNNSCGVNCFGIYDDGVLIDHYNNLTEINGQIKTYTYENSVDGQETYAEARVYYVYLYRGGLITLNSPSDNYISSSQEVEFNCSAEIVSGATLTNISLWTNISGIWSNTNSTTFSAGYNGTNSYDAYSDGLKSQLDTYYKLDESSGAIIDATGNNSGAITGIGVSYGAGGKVNDALYFDKVSGDYLDSDANTGITGAESWTMNSWINVLEQDAVQPNSIFTLGTIGIAGHVATIQVGVPANDLKFVSWGGACEDETIASGVTLVGEWHMITATYDGTNCRLYVDGNNIYNNTGVLAIDNDVFRVGSSGAVNQVFNGTIDEVGLWSRAITTDEIQEIYTRNAETSATETFTEEISGSTLWTCSACDSDGDCGYASSNYTVYLDSTAPTITVESPSGISNYNYVGGNEILNVTFTDTNLGDCWYNYNGTNITIEGCLTGIKNSTTFILESGNTNMTIYSNDTVGNLNSEYISWDYNITEISQTYPVTSVESGSETYTANISYNSSAFGVINSILTLNGTEYISTQTGSGDNVLFSADVTMPSISEETNFTAYWTISLTDASGTNSYNLSSNNVTVSIINMSLCDATNNVPFWNFTILNESNSALINSTFDATFSVKQTGSGTENLFSYTNSVLNYSEYDFCLSPGTESYTIDTNIKITKSGFVDKFYNFEDVIVTNSTREDNLYMLTTADSTSYIIHVVDVSGTDVDSAEVRVQRYYVGTGEWVTTEIVTTNYIGEAVGHLLSEDADYRFKVYQSGVSTYNSTATKIICSEAPCTVTLVIPIDIQTGYEETVGLTSKLTYSSTTNTFTYTYTDSSGNFDSARLHILRIWPSSSTLFVPCNETKTTTSGIISCDISGSVNGTYRASAYITRGGTEFLDRRIDGTLGTNIYNSMGNDGVLWGIFVLIGIIMIGIARPSMAIIFGAVGLFMLSILGIINIGIISLISITIIGIILLMRVGRE